MGVFIIYMATPNLGSALAGDPQAQQAIQAAIQARSQGANVPLAAQTGQQPSAQTPMPTSVAPQGALPQEAQGAVKPPATEAELIIKGLTQRLSAISKVETASVESPAQPTPKVAPTI